MPDKQTGPTLTGEDLAAMPEAERRASIEAAVMGVPHERPLTDHERGILEGKRATSRAVLRDIDETLADLATRRARYQTTLDQIEALLARGTIEV